MAVKVDVDQGLWDVAGGMASDCAYMHRLHPPVCRHTLAITLIAGEQDLQPAYNSECNYRALIMAAIHISLDN